MEEKKVASIKLVSGEEIICTLLSISKDGPYTIVTIKDPVRIDIRDRRRNKSYTLTDWLMFRNDGMHDIEVSKIITVNQIDDIELLHSYDNYFKNALNAPKPRASKKIGFLGNVNDYKKTLEKIYKDLDSHEKNA